MTPPPDPRRLAAPAASARLVIRDIQPSTPLGAAIKGVVGDPTEVSTELVRDGHGVLAARLRWRPVGGRSWSAAPMVERNGRWWADLHAEAPGFVEFEVQAWLDRAATWRRDISRRAAAGVDLGVEFVVGADLYEERAQALRGATARRVLDAAATLRSTTCRSDVRLAAGTDDAVAAALDSIPDAHEVATSSHRLWRVDRERAVSGAWYELFPRSEGGFVEGAPLWERIEQIAADGFDVVYVPPIHPIGVTARKGRNNSVVSGPGDVGSPWAIGSADGGFEAVHRDLGTLADVERFVARVGELGMEVALDVALQCSPDHPWVGEHPEWFTQLPDGSIRTAENPPKRYEDIYPLDFWPSAESDRLALWEACRGVFEYWAERGVRIFRVDNPHTKPIAFWSWVIPALQSRWPDLVFLAEAFTDPSRMQTLAEVGFSQSYTYFTWRTTKWELESYGEELARGPASAYFRPNFWPTTPDILSGPLRRGTSDVFKVRALLAATMSPSWGVYSGYELCENEPQSDDNEEFASSEKYQIRRRDWSAPGSISDFVAELNRIRRDHPCLLRIGSLRFCPTGSDTVLAYAHHRFVPGAGTDAVIVVVNLTPDVPVETVVHVDLNATGLSDAAEIPVRDELTGERWTWRPGANYVRFDPLERVGHILTVDHG